MKVEISPYKLNTIFHGKNHDGTLLKVEFASGQQGYADLHPWPELGDIPLAAALKSLQDGLPALSVKRALHWAARDAEARADGRSLFLGLMIPRSHFLVANIYELSNDHLASLSAEGYRAIKVKMGQNLEKESQHIKALLKSWPDGLKLRIDMNCRPSRPSFETWSKNWWSVFGHLCDVLEDPIAENEKPLTQSSWPLFRDRTKLSHQFQGVVIKPEVFENESNSRLRTIVTNNLGHPLGHSVAMFEAARLAGGEICGLQGLQHYPRDRFIEGVRYHGPLTLGPSGTGFGFDDSLARLKWRKWI